MILTSDPASIAIFAQRQFLCEKNAGQLFLCLFLLDFDALYLGATTHAQGWPLFFRWLIGN